MALNWKKSDYFPDLLRKNKESHLALEKLVDDLHTEKEKTISSFLCHSGSEDFLWGLVYLLGEDITRVAGNAAYIIGTLAESELGCYRVLALAHSGRSESEQILPNLTRMLAFDDSESVMNAAGTMGTLAESPQGRDWILSTECFNTMLDHSTVLLHTENMWTASNAALVLARISISEEGCNKILDHPSSLHILTQLVTSLGTDEAGRGMNAAFAIGRLSDMDIGRERLLALSECDKMISSLAKMLSCQDLGASKNACFALSCLATSCAGHGRLLRNPHIDEMISVLSNLLKSEDSETGWFSAMTIRTLSSQPKGCVKLRENQPLISVLKTTVANQDINPDLKEEVEITLDILKRLDKPNPPNVEALDSSIVKVYWDEIKPKSRLEVHYQVYEGNHSVYKGSSCTCTVESLQPNAKYSFKLQCFTENDESPFSDSVFATTLEGAPGPPTNIRVLGCTITQLKIGWDPPNVCNGTVKGYYVYQGSKPPEFTTDVTCIVTGLSPNTQYTIEVCAATSKGKGEKSSVVGTTAEIGAHAPSKPNVTVLGRNEVHVSWASPEVPLGRITRYDVSMNGKTVHSGTDLSCSVHRLTPDTEYTFVVIAVTSEGKFDSKPTKKRTAKDEYDGSRAPLYQPPSRDSISEDTSQTTTNPKPPPVTKKRRSVGDIKTRIHSGNKNLVKGGGSSDIQVRPDSGTSSVVSKTSSKTAATTSTDVNHQTAEIKKPKAIIKAPQTEKRRESNANTVQQKPKIENRRSSFSTSLPKDTSQIHRKLTDRYPNLMKSMFPVTVSYVSIQGDSGPTELDYRLKTSGAWTRKPIGRAVVVSNNKSSLTFKFDRPKPVTMAVTHQSPIKAKLSQPDPDVPVVLDSDILYEDKDLVPENHSEMPNRDRKPSLPKPTLPSQQYLEGGRNSIGEVSKSWSIPHQPSLKESANEIAENHRNRRQIDYIRELTSLPAFRGTTQSPADNTHNAFIQRANTFVNTHRSSLRRSIERTVSKPSGVTGPLNFNPEIPENPINKQHDKFVPMQLRTNPSHLPQTQTSSQKVSANLLEPRGYPGRRLESLTRNHSGNRGKSPINRRGSAKGQCSDELITIASQEIIKQEKITPKKPQVRTLNSKHLNEPDSVRLSQSWAVNAR
ncbi:hypothetical protein LOTGIDRAFT_155985 [Lottia gigantea]|uniref:Fibronectin type-III domain-containing protein n=1 Tax=Lottia gigantea TaxID=225164 RepID=V4BB42_LOTGI|nr:hypothetical protein LOTGIDRAFT_155985 [Lottia gigantea]ESP04761.1 hypothetical protein LOTGIDRAFT_155985 [Lottia gigantea]